MNNVSSAGRKAARHVALWLSVMLIGALSILSWSSIRSFELAIKPELSKRSELIGEIVRDEVERALSIGVPVDSVTGLNDYMHEILLAFSEVDRISYYSKNNRLIDAVSRVDSSTENQETESAGIVTATQNQFVFPVIYGNTIIGEIRVEIDPKFVETRLQDVFLDILVVALVAILLAFEIVLYISSSTVGKPLERIFRLIEEQNQGVFIHVVKRQESGVFRRITRRLSDRTVDLAAIGKSKVIPQSLRQLHYTDIRLPLFLFSTATEISGAFLPLYARDAGGPAWMSGELAATAPLIAYLVAMTLMAPFSGQITRKLGHRNLFVIAVPLAAVAMVGVGLGQTAIAISLWHGAMALVYALATVACQEFAIQTAPKEEQTRALGSFLAVILGGAFCGTAIGGVLADRVGEDGTFFVGAAIAAVSGIIGYFTISSSKKSATAPDGPKQTLTTGRYKILRRPRFVALLLCITVPINIGMSVFIWYLTPVILEEAGATISDIGRVVMIYYLIPILLGPTIAKLADGRVGNSRLLFGGILISAIGLLSVSVVPFSDFWSMFIAVALFGLGHSMCDATQYSQAITLGAELPENDAAQFGLSALRLTERIGAIVGLIASVVLIKKIGHASAVQYIGLLMFLGMVGFGVFEFGGKLLLKYQKPV